MLTFNLSRQNFGGQHPPMSFSGLEFVGQSEVAVDPFAVSVGRSEKDSEHQIENLRQGSEQPWGLDECPVMAHSNSCSTSNRGSPTSQSDTSEKQSDMEYQRVQPIAPRATPTLSASSTPRSQPVDFPTQTASASSINERSSTPSHDGSIDSTHWRAAPSATPLHSPGAADKFRQQPKLYQDTTHSIETAGMLISDPNGLAPSSGLKRCSSPLDTCDPKDLIKKSR